MICMAKSLVSSALSKSLNSLIARSEILAMKIMKSINKNAIPMSVTAVMNSSCFLERVTDGFFENLNGLMKFSSMHYVTIIIWGAHGKKSMLSMK